MRDFCMKHDALETSAAKIEKFFQRRPQSTLYKREETWGKSQLAEACTTCTSLSAKRRKAVTVPCKDLSEATAICDSSQVSFSRFLLVRLVVNVCPRCRTLMETLNTRLISLLLSSNLIKLRNEGEMCSQRVQSLYVTDNLYLSNSGQSSGEKPNGKSILSCAHCLVFLIINLLSPRHAITFQWCYTALSISRMRLQGVIINTMSGLIHEWITCRMNGNNKKGNPKYSDNKDYCERINQKFFSGKPENFYKHCFHLCPPRLKTV